MSGNLLGLGRGGWWTGRIDAVVVTKAILVAWRFNTWKSRLLLIVRNNSFPLKKIINFLPIWL